MPEKKISMFQASLEAGKLRYSKAEIYRVAAYRKLLRNGKIPGDAREVVTYVEKEIEKDGKKMIVRTAKMMAKSMPQGDIPMPRKLILNKHKLRKSITPGTVGILLKGPQKARRVIFIKQLESGLLMVANPVSGDEPTTIDHRYFMSTKLKLDISGVKVPEEMVHTHFHNKAERRKAYLKARRTATVLGEGENKPAGFTDEQKAINKKLVDQLADIVQKHPESPVLEGYMKTKFRLTHRDFPHRMNF